MYSIIFYKSDNLIKGYYFFWHAENTSPFIAQIVEAIERWP